MPKRNLTHSQDAGLVKAPGAGARAMWLPRVATVVVVAALVVLAREAATRSIDFPVYHRAAQQILAGNYELYPPEAYGGQPHPSQGFRYAPAIAFLFFPLGWLSLETAALLFYGLKLAALWWVVSTIARRMGATSWGRRAFIISFLVVGGYVVEELRFGNAHFFVVALMVFAYDRVEAGGVVLDRRRIAVGLLATAAPATLLPLVFGGHSLALIYEASSPYTFGAIVLLGILVAMTLERKASVLSERRSVDPRDVSGNLSAKVGV